MLVLLALLIIINKHFYHNEQRKIINRLLDKTNIYTLVFRLLLIFTSSQSLETILNC